MRKLMYEVEVGYNNFVFSKSADAIKFADMARTYFIPGKYASDLEVRITVRSENPEEPAVVVEPVDTEDNTEANE